MSVLRVSGAVRTAMGVRNADALAAGVGLPAQGQCYGCGEMLTLAAERPGSVCLSTVLIGAPGGGSVTIDVFSHARCGPSRVFTPEEFEACAQALQAATSVPVHDLVVQQQEPVGDDQALIVEGRRVL